MSYPRLYSEITAANDHANSTDYDAMVNALRGFAASGTFKSPYSYVVVSDGTDTYACNAYQVIYGGPSDTGGVDGADSTAVIQAALNNLTNGRTHKETVIIYGNYTLSAALEVKSYTHLVLNGKLTLAASADSNIIENENQAAGDTYIEIEGGDIDGNKSNQTGGGTGILLTRCSNIKVHDIHIQNMYLSALETRYAQAGYVQIDNVSVDDCNGGIGIGYATGGPVTLSNIHVRDIAGSGNGIVISGGSGASSKVVLSNFEVDTTGGLGVSIDGDSNTVSVSNGVIRNTTGDGFNLEGWAEAVNKSPHECSISNITLYGCRFALAGLAAEDVDSVSVSAITVHGNGVAAAGVYLWYCRNAALAGIVVHNAGYAGLDLTECHNITVNGVVSYNNNQSAAGFYGIYLNNSVNCIIIGRTYDDQTPKTQAGGLKSIGTSDNNIYLVDTSGNTTEKSLVETNYTCLGLNGTFAPYLKRDAADMILYAGTKNTHDFYVRTGLPGDYTDEIIIDSSANTVDINANALKNIATQADGTLSGTPVLGIVYIGATPYYFKMYPTVT